MAGKLDARGTIGERIWSRFLPDELTGCWNWTGAISAGSYGAIFYEGRMQKAHRVMWRLERGEIPEGLQVDHLCRNRRCINPDHLEPVTASENMRRSPLMDRHSHRTHCVRGHEFTPENTRHKPVNGHRVCKECMRMHVRNWRARYAVAS